MKTKKIFSLGIVLSCTGLLGSSLSPSWKMISFSPGADAPAEGIYSIGSAFGQGGCTAKNASEAIRCIKKAIQSEPATKVFGESSATLTKSDFTLQAQGSNPVGFGYRFEESLRGVVVQDSLASVNVDDKGLVVSIDLKLAAVPAKLPVTSRVSEIAAVSSAIDAAKAQPSNNDLQFTPPKTSLSGTQNPRVVDVESRGIWHLAYDIELQSSTGCEPPQVNRKECRRYRANVDALDGKIISLVSLLDQ